MGAAQNYDWQRAMASALDWWRDAGVDVAIAEVPHDWLAPVEEAAPVARRSVTRPAEPLVPTPRTFDFPEDLNAFEAWRLSEAAPDGGWPGARIGAQRPAGQLPDLMVAVEMPDRDEAEEGILLGGAPGRLFDRMLAAIGHSRQSAYIVPMAVARPPGGRLPADDLPALGAALLHQVALARPKRLLVFGNAPSRVLLGAEIQPARGLLHEVKHKAGTVDAVASFHPRLLLDRPAAKQEAWRDLQLLIRGQRS